MHPVLRSHADARFGLFTTAEALSVGYRKSEIRDLCSNNRWVRLRRGILVTAQDLTHGEARGRRFAMECLAIQLSLDRPTALFSHGTAARLWGLPTPRRLDPTIRLTDATQWRTGHGWRMTCAPLSSADRWRSGLLRLTSAARTLSDCAREWPLEDAVVAMDAALLACRTTDHELRDAVTAIPRWPGASRARRAAAFADGRAESPLETRGRLRIIGGGASGT